MPVHLYKVKLRLETLQTGLQVGKIYSERVLDGTKTAVMFTTKVAYGLQVYETVSQYGEVDFNYYVNAHYARFGVNLDKALYTGSLPCTKFYASPDLIARLDAVGDVILKTVKNDQVKVCRNSVIAYLFRLVIDYDRGTVHYIEKDNSCADKVQKDTRDIHIT